VLLCSVVLPRDSQRRPNLRVQVKSRLIRLFDIHLVAHTYNFITMLAIQLPAVAGLVAHWGIFIRGEWHLRTRLIVSVHLGLAIASFWILRYNASQFAEALWGLFLVASCYLATLFTSMSIYRLFLHPLSRFPGPKAAAISKLWHVYRSRNSTNFLVMDDMHKRYGTLVRTGKPLPDA
jgi:hypothetical protein